MKNLAIISTTLLIAVLALDSRITPQADASASSVRTTTGGVSLNDLPLESSFTMVYDISNFPTGPFSLPTVPYFYSGRTVTSIVDPGKALVITKINVIGSSNSNNTAPSFKEFAVGVDGQLKFMHPRPQPNESYATMHPIVVRENQELRIETRAFEPLVHVTIQGYYIDMTDL